MRLITTTLGITILFISCGPSAQQQAAIQQHHDDSIANATKMAQHHRDDSIANAVKEADIEREGLQNRLSALKNAYANTKADLDVALDEMSQIKQFHVLRDPSEREAQIKQQDLKIQGIKSRLDELSGEINQCEQSLAVYQ